MAQNKSSNGGFRNMDEKERQEISSLGGQSQGKENNPRNFANRDDANEAASEGGEQSRSSRNNR